MFRAFMLKNDDAFEVYESIEALKENHDPDYAKMWVDIQTKDMNDLVELRDLLGLEQAAIEDALSGEQRPRIDEFEEQVFLLLYGAVGPDEELAFSPRKLSIFLTPRLVVTAHEETLRTINRLRKRVRTKGDAVLKRGTDFLVYTIVDSLVDNFLLVAEAFDTRVEKLEEESLEPDVGASILEECSDLRRDMLELRRIAASMHEVIQPILSSEIDYIAEDLEPRFAHVRDHIVKTLETIDTLRELLHGVRDNYHAALANRTNRVVQTLTIFATIFLPLTLIAGIYGMNTPLWPAADRPWSFWFVLGAMAVTGVAMYAYFRLRKLI